MKILRKAKEFSGVLLFDFFRYVRALLKKDLSWVGICNRNETLVFNADHSGALCKWKLTSKLHAPRYLPFLGLKLMEKSLKSYPIRLAKNKDAPILPSDPDVTFVYAIRIYGHPVTLG